MRYLFFLVHPSKYYVFRHTINQLLENGHHVDTVITSKDVLEELITNEGWNYKNIFPEGRKIKALPTYIGAALNTLRTIWRMECYLRKYKRYDLFITDDLLVVNGCFRRIPSILFQDDDVTAVPESALLHFFATHILTPTVSNMGRYSHKALRFEGYKELGSFHPDRFKPDESVVQRFNPSMEKYSIIRLVSLKSTHDVGKSGLSNDDVLRVLAMLQSIGNVYISSERALPEQFEKYRIKIIPNDMPHALYHAQLLIADSQTMCAEAAILGTPFVRFNDFVGRISYLDELENKYGLGFGIKPRNKQDLFDTINYLITTENLKQEWAEKRDRMISDKIDLTRFMYDLFSRYPDSLVNNPKTKRGV